MDKRENKENGRVTRPISVELRRVKQRYTEEPPALAPHMDDERPRNLLLKLRH